MINIINQNLSKKFFTILPFIGHLINYFRDSNLINQLNELFYIMVSDYK